MKKDKILFCSFPDFSGNSKSLYDYMKKRNVKNLIWIIFDEKVYNKLKESNVNCYLYKSSNFKKVFESSKIIFDTHGLLYKYKDNGQIYVNLWHGTGVKQIGYLMKEEQKAPHDNYYYGTIRNKMDYITVPSEFWRALYCAVFFFPSERILSLGMPRVDEFYVNKRQKIEEILNIDLKKYKKIGIYLPTFKKGINRKVECEINIDNSLNLEAYDENKLTEYLEKNNILLLIKYHPSEEIKFKKNNSQNIIYLSENLFSDNNITLYNILNITDFMLTDYSSVYIEYLVLNKPIIFLHNDIKTYKKKRGLLFDNEEFWFPGARVDTLNALLSELTNILENFDSYEQKRNTFKRLMFDNKEKSNCKRIFDYFFDKNGNLNKDIKIYDSDYNRYDECKKELEIERQKNIILHNETIFLRHEIDDIKKSKGYKLLEKIRRVIRKIKR